MSDYIEDCINKHIEGMIARENELKIEIKLLEKQLSTLNSERTELEVGIVNWTEERENM